MAYAAGIPCVDARLASRLTRCIFLIPGRSYHATTSATQRAPDLRDGGAPPQLHTRGGPSMPDPGGGEPADPRARGVLQVSALQAPCEGAHADRRRRTAAAGGEGKLRAYRGDFAASHAPAH